MICPHCGAEIPDDDALACPNCGGAMPTTAEKRWWVHTDEADEGEKAQGQPKKKVVVKRKAKPAEADDATAGEVEPDVEPVQINYQINVTNRTTAPAKQGSAAPLVLGIVGIVLGVTITFSPFGMACNIIGCVFSKSAASASVSGYKALNIVGIVINALAILLMLGISTLLLVGIATEGKV